MMASFARSQWVPAVALAAAVSLAGCNGQASNQSFSTQATNASPSAQLSFAPSTPPPLPETPQGSWTDNDLQPQEPPLNFGSSGNPLPGSSRAPTSRPTNSRPPSSRTAPTTALASKRPIASATPLPTSNPTQHQAARLEVLLTDLVGRNDAVPRGAPKDWGYAKGAVAAAPGNFKKYAAINVWGQVFSVEGNTRYDV